MDSAVTITGISSDIPCMDCGYNLRTLSPDARCPECGRYVQASLDFHASWNQPSGIRRLRTGAFLLAASQIAWLVIAPVLMLIKHDYLSRESLLFWSLIVFDGPRPWAIGAIFGERRDPGQLLIGIGFLLVPLVAQIIALGRFATPTLEGEQPYVRSRSHKWLRNASAIGPALLSIMFAANAFGVRRGGTWGTLVALMIAGDMLLAVLLSSRLGRIARRLNRPVLGLCARIVGFGIVVADALFAVHLVNYLLFGFRGNTLIFCLLGIHSLAFFSLCQLPVAILLTRSLNRLVRFHPAPQPS